MTVSRFNFRVWDKTCNQLFYDAQDTYDFTRGTPTPIMADSFGELIEDTENFHLMQSTGMVDKNGKEIFEGDVVVGNCQQFVVCFQYCQFVLKKIHRYEEKEYDYSLCCFEKHNIEVIGNIYEKLELLKEFKENDSK